MDERMLARFWEKVDKNGPTPAHAPELGPCHVWTACRLKAGYGLFGADKLSLAHRVAYKIACGQIPAGKCVLHRCDNPACVRAEHLTIGTPRENTLDMIAKGRGRLTGAANGNAKIDEDAARAIVLAVRGGEPRRDVAARFGVSRSAVEQIMAGRNWSKATGIRRAG